jgi:hypothetical protein
MLESFKDSSSILQYETRCSDSLAFQTLRCRLVAVQRQGQDVSLEGGSAF